MRRDGSRALRGLALAEVLTAAALGALLAAAGLAVWADAAVRGAMGAAEVSVAAALRAARVQAVLQDRPVRLVWDGEGAAWFLAARTPAGDWERTGEGRLLPSRTGLVPVAPVPCAEPPWPGGLESAPQGLEAMGGRGIPAGVYGFLEFAPGGGTLAGRRVVLAPREAGKGGRFREPARARVFLMRGSGAFTLLAGRAAP